MHPCSKNCLSHIYTNEEVGHHIFKVWKLITWQRLREIETNLKNSKKKTKTIAEDSY